MGGETDKTETDRGHIYVVGVEIEHMQIQREIQTDGVCEASAETGDRYNGRINGGTTHSHKAISTQKGT